MKRNTYNCPFSNRKLPGTSSVDILLLKFIYFYFKICLWDTKYSHCNGERLVSWCARYITMNYNDKDTEIFPKTARTLPIIHSASTNFLYFNIIKGLLPYCLEALPIFLWNNRSRADLCPTIGSSSFQERQKWGTDIHNQNKHMSGGQPYMPFVIHGSTWTRQGQIPHLPQG